MNNVDFDQGMIWSDRSECLIGLTRLFFFYKLQKAVASEALKAFEYLPFPCKSYQLWPLSHLKQKSTQPCFGGGGESTTTITGGGCMGGVLKEAKIKKIVFLFKSSISIDVI